MSSARAVDLHNAPADILKAPYAQQFVISFLPSRDADAPAVQGTENHPTWPRPGQRSRCALPRDYRWYDHWL